MNVSFIDLFCGIGGIRLGVQSQNFKCVMSCDINSECRLNYKEKFFETPQGDIKEIVAEDIPDFDILCAGFPCQPFSISGKKKGFEDTRGTLFFDICRIIDVKQPKIIFLENVKHLKYHDKGRTLTKILSSLEDLNYQVTWKILNANDFGVPQNRERIIIIGSKNKIFDFKKINYQPRKNLIDFLDTEGDFEFLDESEYTLLDEVKKQSSGLIFAGYRNK